MIVYFTRCLICIEDHWRSNFSSRSDRPVYVKPKKQNIVLSILHPCMIVGPAVSCFIPNIYSLDKQNLSNNYSFNKKRSHLGRRVFCCIFVCLPVFSLSWKMPNMRSFKFQTKISSFSEEYKSRASRHQKGVGIVGNNEPQQPNHRQPLWWSHQIVRNHKL